MACHHCVRDGKNSSFCRGAILTNLLERKGMCKEGHALGAPFFKASTCRRRGAVGRRGSPLTFFFSHFLVTICHLSRKGFCRNLRGNYPNKVLGEFFGGFFFNSVQTRCIVKGEAQKSPLFWRFFACSLGIPQENL